MVPSRDPADAWKGEDATEEVCTYWQTLVPGYSGTIYSMHPEFWAAWPESMRLKLEPYEVRVVSKEPGAWVYFNA